MRKKRATLVRFENGRHRLATPAEAKFLARIREIETGMRGLQQSLRREREVGEEKLRAVLSGELREAIPAAEREAMMQKLIAEIAKQFGQQVAAISADLIRKYGEDHISFEAYTKARAFHGLPHELDVGSAVYVIAHIREFTAAMGIVV